MKAAKFLLAIMFLAVANGAFANPVDVETAQRVAQNFMNQSRGSTANTIAEAATEFATQRFAGESYFHVVNFQEGGWVMVSGESATTPILAFSHDGEFCLYEEKPPALLMLLEGYKKEIAMVRSMRTARCSEIAAMWDYFLDDNAAIRSAAQQATTQATATGYIPGRILLNVPGRGHVRWGQSRNYDGGCNPSFNSEVRNRWWHGWLHNCPCDAPPVGCGAVAMGQIMWYWQFPTRYAWFQMPALLRNTTPATQATAIARLLLDITDAASTNFNCGGTWSYNNERAFRTFGFNEVRRVNRSSHSLASWNELIRNEIHMGRPVFYYGERALLSGKKHYFIVDGIYNFLEVV